MSATATTVTAREFQADLEKLMQLAFNVASAEAELEAYAAELEKADKCWQIDDLGSGRLTPLQASVNMAMRLNMVPRFKKTLNPLDTRRATTVRERRLAEGETVASY